MSDSACFYRFQKLACVSVAAIALMTVAGAAQAAGTPAVVLTNAPVPDVPLSSPQKIDLYWDVTRPELPPGVAAGVLPCVATKVQSSTAKIQVSAGNHMVYGFGFVVPGLAQKVGDAVPVALAFDRAGPFMSGTAAVSAPSTLVLNVANGNTLYERLGAASYMTLTLPNGAAPVRFDLAGVRTALGEVETCYAQGSGSAPKGASAPVAAVPVVMAPRAPDTSLARPTPTLTETVNVPPPKLDTARIMGTVPNAPVPVVDPMLAPQTPISTVPVVAAAPVAPVVAAPVAPVVVPVVDATPPVPIQVTVPPPAYGSSTTPAAPVMAVLPSSELAPDAPKDQEILAVANKRVAPPPAPVAGSYQMGDGSTKNLDDAGFVAIEPPSPNVMGDVTALNDTARAVPPPPMGGDVPALIPPKLIDPVPGGQVTDTPVPTVPAPISTPAPVIWAEPVAPLPEPQPVTPVAATSTPSQTLVVQGPTPVAAPVPASQVAAAAPQVMVDTFRARVGESFRDVVRRWSARAGIDLVWNMPQDIILERDFSYVGEFKTALDQLVAQYPESGIKTTFAPQGVQTDNKPFIAESQAPDVAPVAVAGDPLDDVLEPRAPDDVGREPVPAPVLKLPEPAPAPAVTQAPPVVQNSGVIELSNDVTKPVPVVAPPPAPVQKAVTASAAAAQKAPTQPVGPVQRWRALQGASMHQVLQAWAEDADVKLLWLTPSDFMVRHSVNQTADYGRAVLELLNQYAFEPVRPMGQIYQDPGTGKRTLVVRDLRN